MTQDKQGAAYAASATDQRHSMPPGPQPNSPVGERADSEVGGGSPAGAVLVNACQVNLRTEEDKTAFADIVAAATRHMQTIGEIETALMAEMRLGDCIACDTGEPVRLFLDVQRGDAVNCCETCCAKWAEDIIRGVTGNAPQAPLSTSDPEAR